MFPSWYAMPGNDARNAGGDISDKKMAITPQAPCTPNWTQNAPAARAEKLLGMIHSGMKMPASSKNTMIVNRRPTY